MTTSLNRRPARLGAAALALTAAVAAASGCSSSSNASSKSGPVALRLGYFPNLTHATAIVGVEKGLFAAKLGKNVKLTTATFNAGPAAIEALFSGAIDATYIGPSPSINGYAKSHGEGLRIISGATSGGAALVVKASITSAAQLKGKTIASPQLGNTQDVALRFWLKGQGYTTDQQGGGAVHVKPEDNSTTVTAFGTGAIDGAWVPEPYASRLVSAGGHVLVDEKSLWPGGKFVTTQLIVRTAFLEAHADVVKQLLAGQIAANDYVNKNASDAQAVVNAALGKLTGKPLKAKTLAAAWKEMTFTNDPLASTLQSEAAHAEALGLIKKVDLSGIYNLDPLNSALKAAGQSAVTAS